MPARRPAQERFREKVNVNGPVPKHVPGLGPCWVWTAAKDENGYGKFGIGVGNCIVSAHRYAWIMIYGEVPMGLGVLHKCDNPSCVNIKHLFLGTQADNARDCELKGRHKHHLGEASKMHKLTNMQVQEIRALVAAKKYSRRDVAALFNVSHTLVNGIMSGKYRILT